jgi:hypothetical protein
MIRIFTLALVILCGLAAQTIAAPERCSRDFQALAIVLFNQHGETTAAEMLAANGNAIHLFISPATGTWTLTATAPGGTVCILGFGQDFQAITPPPPKAEGELH